MQVQMKGTLTGIKKSKGSGVIEGQDRKWDSTTFYILSELPSKNENAIGMATQDYKFGTSDEFEKWRHMTLPVVVDVELTITTNGKGTQATEVTGLKPNKEQPPRAVK